MSRTARIAVVVVLLIAVGVGAALIARNRQAPAGTNRIVVLAPCGFSTPVTVAANLFRKAHPEITLEVVTDNANVLVNKIRDGNLTGDAFMSPGETEIRLLVDSGHIDPATITDWGSLDMVVLASLKAEEVRSVQDLALPSVSIAMANPKTNSVGAYGQAMLERLGLWDKIKGKVQTPAAPLEAIQLVESGSADAGIAYLTCPLDTNPEKASKSSLRIVETIPRDLHPPVRLQVGLFKKAGNKEGARAFLEFLRSKEGQDALKANGVLPVETIR